MTNVNTPNQFGNKPAVAGAEVKGMPRIAEQHKSAATNFETAAKHHTEAARHHEAGNVEKASESTNNAVKFGKIATESQNEALKETAKSK